MSIQPRTRIAALATLLLSVMLPHGEARADEPSPQVKVTTNMGEFVIEVRQDRSPLTAANFLRYVREGSYSGNAQFYVNLVDNPDLDPVSTRWGYTVFGRIVQGMDVIDHVGETPTGSVGPFKADAPLKPVIIEKVEIIAAGATRPPPELTPVPPPRQDTILSPK